MRIVHCSRTPCAGAIYALSTAINDHTEHESRWISYGGNVNNLSFPFDLCWWEADVFPVLARAGVIVCHPGGNTAPMDETQDPVRDFVAGDPSKRVFGFYHTHPDATNTSMAERGKPHFCVAQYQALLFPKAMPVRNVIRFDRADFPKRKVAGHKIRIGYSPTFRRDQKDVPEKSAIWYHSKGFDFTNPVLKELAEKGNVEYVLIEGMPYDMALDLKSTCDILVDEVATGSYHRSTLEALALGIPCVSNVDSDVHGVLLRAAGANDFPIVHATRETLMERLEWLIAMPRKKRLAMGDAARDWMVRHWHPKDIARTFCAALEAVPVPEAR